MVIRLSQSQRGTLLVEVMIALSIVVLVMIPLSMSVQHEQLLCRAYYYRAIAMEIVDGEMEVLAAGEWRAFSMGVHDYPIRAESAKNLPPGRFILTLRDQFIRLEWTPTQKDKGGRVWRQIPLPETIKQPDQRPSPSLVDYQAIDGLRSDKQQQTAL